EFCIDKLFPPVGQGSRLGLLELRAFEMAPHYRMGLAEMLLVRALVSTFWKQPFTADLIRWGPALHDRFMLPHFVQDDFTAVLGHLRRAGFAFEDAWFAPHRAFRFPRIGLLRVGGMELELRQALEPWNVLAEEATSGGTGRSVDSSLERMQVRLSGFDPGQRYVVSCNGRRVPLHPTAEPGESVAGIRYRARKLSAALHPTIPVHTPLVFDLIDTWGTRSGRCTYHAAPPDGSVYPGRPADAAEAQARRLQRFVIDPHPPASLPLPPPEQNPLYPMTLDLRWPAHDARVAPQATLKP
ncbi:MAG TPA: transglutaminase family protein, partial [Acidobacteriaceae bacterium]